MPRSTSFRISDDAKRRLASRAERDGLSATSLLERLNIEGVDALDHPGLIHRGPPHARHPEQVQARIEANDRAVRSGGRNAQQHDALLA